MLFNFHPKKVSLLKDLSSLLQYRATTLAGLISFREDTLDNKMYLLLIMINSMSRS